MSVTTPPFLLRRLSWVTLVLACIGAPGFGSAEAADTTTWRVTGAAGSCVLESAPTMLDDGYIETEVRLRFFGNTLSASTGSVIDLARDLGVSDLGVTVDDHEIIPIAALDGETDVRLAGNSDDFVEQFIRGGQAQLRLRFWPTWPSQGTRTAQFSLSGFTRAWKAFSACR